MELRFRGPIRSLSFLDRNGWDRPQAIRITGIGMRPLQKWKTALLERLLLDRGPTSIARSTDEIHLTTTDTGKTSLRPAFRKASLGRPVASAHKVDR